MTCGIYKITNKITGESYIGLSKNIERRWMAHKTPSRGTTVSNFIKKYGKDNFSLEILEECSLDELSDKEKYYVALYDTKENGMNLTSGGETPFNSSGYYRVHKVKDPEHSALGYYFRYIITINKKQMRLSSISIVELEKKVKEKDLPWIIVDKEKADKTLHQNSIDLKNHPHNYNKTGYYHVFKQFNANVIQEFHWSYHYKDDSGKIKYIKSVDLNDLKEKVLSHGFKWEVLDEDKAKRSDDENNLNNKNRVKYHHTGLYRVTKIKGKQYAQGFAWRYTFYDESGKKRNISRTDLYKLKEEVLACGFKWGIVDDEKAKLSFEENEKAVDYVHNHVRNNTGFYNVSKIKCKTCLNGFVYTYSYYINGNKKQMSAVDINVLEQKVKAKGLEWRIIDEVLVNKILSEN